MAKIHYRGNLSAAIYPMTLAGSGRAVIMPGPDQNFDRRVDPQGEQKDAGIPQAIYMENVFPTVNGYQSVGYLDPKQPIPLPFPVKVAGVAEIEVRSSTGNIYRTPVFYLSNGTYKCGATGIGVVNFTGTPPQLPFVGPPALPSLAVAKELISLTSTAVVGDRAYAKIAGQIYEVNGTVFDGYGFQELNLVNVSALVTPTNFFSTIAVGPIAGSNNYLVGSDLDTIFYSSLTNPLDFVSSLVSGAGQGNPNNLKGAIISLSETQDGFYIFAQESTILAKYTNNNRYPWKYVVVRNVSGPAANPGSIYGNVHSKTHYILDTNNQVKVINEDVAEDIGPEVSEFLANGVVQQLYNTVANTFNSLTQFTRNARIYVLNERYIFVSINNSTGVADEYSAAIVYDILLKRYGKVNVCHTAIYEIVVDQMDGSGSGNVRKSVGFLDSNIGKIFVLNIGPYPTVENGQYLKFNSTPQNSVLILGKFQYARSRFIKLEELDIEGVKDIAINSPQNFSCVLLPSLDGYNFLPGQPLVPSLNANGLIRYPAHTTCQNFALALKGSFDISTIQLGFTSAGER